MCKYQISIATCNATLPKGGCQPFSINVRSVVHHLLHIRHCCTYSVTMETLCNYIAMASWTTLHKDATVLSYKGESV